VHNFALGYSGGDACAYCVKKDCPEQLRSPALPDACQRRMIWQRIMQSVTHKHLMVRSTYASRMSLRS
jgi:hypothetical protein